MGLLESVIGGVVGQMFGGQRGQGGGAMSPLVKALLMLLLAKGASGGLSDIFGRGHPSEPEPAGGADPHGPAPGRPPAEAGGRDTGDIGGFGQYGGRRAPQPQGDPGNAGDPTLPPGDFSEFSGMLGGPGDASAGPDRGNVSHETFGGLDGLVDRFHQGGLGDVMQSWIGHGANHPVAPDQLAHALGPDTLDTLQSQTGLDRATLLSQLAQALPEVVHALTPRGDPPIKAEQSSW